MLTKSSGHTDRSQDTWPHGQASSIFFDRVIFRLLFDGAKVMAPRSDREKECNVKLMTFPISTFRLPPPPPPPPPKTNQPTFPPKRTILFGTNSFVCIRHRVSVFVSYRSASCSHRRFSQDTNDTAMGGGHSIAVTFTLLTQLPGFESQLWSIFPQMLLS